MRIGDELRAVHRTAAIAGGGLLATAVIPAGAAIGAATGAVGNTIANARAAKVAPDTVATGRRGSSRRSHHYMAEGAGIGAGLAATGALGYSAHRFRSSSQTYDGLRKMLDSIHASVESTAEDATRVARAAGGVAREIGGIAEIARAACADFREQFRDFAAADARTAERAGAAAAAEHVGGEAAEAVREAAERRP